MTAILEKKSAAHLDSCAPRVMYLIDRLHSTEAGAEGVVHRLCRFLPARGFDCSVATFWAGDDVTAQFACPVHVLPFSRPFYWTVLRNSWAFAQLLRSRRVEILHTFFPVSDIWGGIVARLAGCPVLISGRRDMGILRARKHRMPYRLANPFFTQVHAVSEKVREFCINEDGLSPEKVITVPNGVDLRSIDSCQPADRRTEFGVGHESPLIITVANLRPVKGIDTLVRAASLVCRQFPGATFAVIGEAHAGSYLPDLQALARELGVAQNVRFFGRRSDVFALLKASDVFCLPSRSEGMSNALLEAMACDLPCVTTDVGGNPEVMIQNRTGFLVPPENPEVLAERIMAVLRSPDRGRQMGHEGRLVVEAKFTFERMIDRLSCLYESLLEDRGLHCPIRRRQSIEPMLTENPAKVVTTAAS